MFSKYLLINLYLELTDLRLREFELLAQDHTMCTEHSINACRVVVISHVGTFELITSPGIFWMDPKRNVKRGLQEAHSFIDSTYSFIHCFLST